MRPYNLPATLHEYRPDPAQPIDRWVQWHSSANAKTIRRIITDLADRPCSLVVDPFCGAGSTAVAARDLHLPFVGFDCRPEAVCVATAKACGTAQHLDRLSTRNALGTVADLEQFASEMTDDDDFTTACLGFVCLVRGIDLLRSGGMRNDLMAMPIPDRPSTVQWGDSAEPDTWSAVPAHGGGWIGFTSPPFRSPQSTDVAPNLAVLAEKLLSAARRPRPSPVEGSKDFVSRIAPLFARLYDRFGPGRLIVEHEPSGPGTDDVLDVLAEFNRFPHTRVTEVLQTRNFSGHGTLSLLVCDLGETSR